jgi:polyisoprenoid-binding protein YceI
VSRALGAADTTEDWMRTNRTTLLAVIVGLAPAAIAWRTAADPLLLEPQSRLWIDGKSTVRKFSCKAGAFDVAVDAAPGAVAGVLAAQKAVHAVTVTVPAEKMDCGNGTMNEHMLKALKAKDAPTIVFKLSGYDVAKGAAGVEGTLNGTLTLGGVDRAVSIPAQATDEGGRLHVTGTTTVNMPDYGLKPPSLMMGTMKVAPDIAVSFDLYLKN